MEREKEMKRGRVRVRAKGRRGAARGRGEGKREREKERKVDEGLVCLGSCEKRTGEWGDSLAETSRVPASGRDGCSVYRRAPYRAVAFHAVPGSVSYPRYLAADQTFPPDSSPQ